MIIMRICIKIDTMLYRMGETKLKARIRLRFDFKYPVYTYIINEVVQHINIIKKA